ncbi:MAG: BMP family ABC transporter substrate-binding protein, partial [Candidatus Puniceispirillaceae bacterium]
EVIKRAMDGSFEGGLMVGTVANGGVGIAPYHSFDSAIPAGLKAEVDEIKAGIIAGTVNVGG